MEIIQGRPCSRSANFSQFLAGGPLGYNANFSFATSAYLVGDANRYFRAPQVGSYIQDKFQLTPNLSLTAGIRYDWNGAFSEKYGRIYNFEPADYSYDEATGIVDPAKTGFIFPSNYKYATPGVSATTLTGRQWGIAPAWVSRGVPRCLIPSSLSEAAAECTTTAANCLLISPQATRRE